ncbi:MAG: YitT family protein [Clostridiales bacterium]|jgi:uncharacterized membrane-anchored protein YitT (DUF2179 family)|nr:YitT family protein [Clostridiales bacterium]
MSEQEARPVGEQAAALPAHKKSTRRVAGRWCCWIALCFAAACMRAAAALIFINPNGFAVGGVTGIALMVERISNKLILSGWVVAAFNVPLSLLAWKFLNRNFAILSLIMTLIASGLMLMLSTIPQLEALQYVQRDAAGAVITDPRLMDVGQRILAALAGGILSGVALAIMFQIGGSTGGTDILAAMIQKRYNSTHVAWFIMLIDGVIVLSSIFVYDLTAVLLALAEMFVSSKMSEMISHGTGGAAKCEIVTDRPEELAALIMTHLKHGVTGMHVTGMHTGKEHGMLICVIRRRQLPALKRLLREYAKDSFAYAMQTSEVIGQGFRTGE